MAFARLSHLFTTNTLLAGIVLMLLGDMMFSLNDAMGKIMVISFSVGQVLLIRSVGAFIVLGPMLARQGAIDLFHVEKPWLQVLRVIMATADTGLFYAAVVYLPLADAMSFYMAGPIYVTALSHFFLGEKVGWRRQIAIYIGFIGVIIILKPSTAAFSPASMLALAGSIAFAISTVLNRRLRHTSDTTLVTWQTIGALLVGVALVPFDWKAPSLTETGMMLLLGVVSCVAHLLITRAAKLAPASVLAPLHYSLLLWSVILGLVLFSQFPEPRVLIGSAVVVLAGMFIFHRQKIVDDVPADVPKSIN